MCLYPRLMPNPKYKRTKKNGGVIPPVRDKRVQIVPIGCGTCIECRKQYARNWQVRLQEDIKEHKNGVFVTLTFSTASLRKFNMDEKIAKLKGYEWDNAVCARAVRLFLERWRKRTGKSVRHWLVTELGHGTTEHVHIHGIIWTNEPGWIKKHWGYGYVWDGQEVNGKKVNYVTGRTVNYIVKYIAKMDEQHLNYKPIVLCSAGIGRHYVTSDRIQYNKFNGSKTIEYYRTEQGHKIAIPIYYRNKIYTDEQRELLWIQKLDKGDRYICGEKITNRDGESTYYNVLNYHRERTEKLGYPKPEFIWKKKKYEEQRRELLRKKRLEE